jgi:hypothetical protein
MILLRPEPEPHKAERIRAQEGGDATQTEESPRSVLVGPRMLSDSSPKEKGMDSANPEIPHGRNVDGLVLCFERIAFHL